MVKNLSNRLIITIFIGISLILLPAICIGSEPNIPIATLSKKSIDMGTLIKGEDYNDTITITNTGSGPLRIGNISTTCGCTAALLDRRTIEPGESSSLQVRFNSKGFKGHVTKKVTFTTNEPGRKNHTIIISGEIREEIVSIPKSLFIHLPKSGKGSGTILLENTSNYPQRVELGRSNLRSITGILSTNTIEPGGRVELKVTISLSDSRRQVSDKMSIFTPDAKDSKISIPIYARFK